MNDKVVFNDRYELERRVGRGGMAEVWLAHDLLLTRPVAVKVLFPQFAADPAFVARFRREAQAAANLNHPNIVGVYDWGNEGGTYYIVMEYVENRTLSEIIKAEHGIDTRRATMVAADVAAALGFAHRNGVVHRDVKPGNVLIAPKGAVKVADFGIARAITAGTEDNLTQTGSVMGTATYFSPEQAQGLPVDPRSDLYSLGVVMYEMVTGRPPFTGDSPVSIAYKHVQETPTPVRELNPQVPPGFAAIIAKLLQKDPADRYATAEELRTDLRRFRQGEPVAAGAVAPVTAATTMARGAQIDTRPPVPARPIQQLPPPQPPRNPYPVEQGSGRRTGWFVALLLGLLLVLAGLLVVFAKTLGIGEDPVKVAVPQLTQLTITQAETEAKAKGFIPESTAEQNDAPKDVVIRQIPDPGVQLEKGSTIKLVYSSGPQTVHLDDLAVACTDGEAARTLLQAAGFRSVAVVSEPSDACKDGQVVRQDPAAGDYPADRAVTLYVRSGPVATTTTKPKTTTTTTTEPSGDTTTTTSTTTTTTTTTTTLPEDDG
jgi:eukaryotic-like serine/threonine-protein kinase